MNGARGMFRTLAALLLLAALALGGGCSGDTGPYAEAKNDWDAAPSDAERHDLRIRLATTQQDH